MQSLYGIPIYNMANHYTYFADLANIEHNSVVVGELKLNLLNAAQSNIKAAINKLKAPRNIKKAVDFINMVATHERHKEMEVVRQYCRKQKKKYPFLHMSEKEILADPYNFYLQLINYLNKARQTGKRYRQELQRIRLNAGQIDKSMKKHGRNEYSEQDFRYTLQSDLESLLGKFIGTFRANSKSPEAYTTQVQLATIKVLNEFGIGQKMVEGVDYAAIASGVLIELQDRLQFKFEELIEADYKNQESRVKILKKEIEKITDNYIEQIRKGENLSGIQVALTDLTSSKTRFILDQLINGLGLTHLTRAADITNQLSNRKKALDSSRKVKDYKQIQKQITAGISIPLDRSLRTITFTKFGKNTGHGNIYEVLKSIIHSSKDKGLFIQGNGATDIMKIMIGYEVNDDTDESINQILRGINDILSSNEFKQNLNDKGELQLKAHQINEALIKAEKQLDELLNNIDTEEKFFIFHDSLKLQSSIETGKSAAFKGRNINLISAADTILNAMNSVMPTTPIEMNLLINLILNLSPEAASEGNSSTNIDILTNYFSKFVGLLMFDDAEQMAREAILEIKNSKKGVSYSKIGNLHLYLLNGVYVPASFILTYIKDNINIAYHYSEEDIAQVEINIEQATKIINDWLDAYYNGKKKYSIGEWRRVAANISSVSVININFLRAFINLVNELFEKL